MHIVKGHIVYTNKDIKDSALLLGGIGIYDKKCNNKHVHQIFQKREHIVPRGRSHWAALIRLEKSVVIAS